MTNGAVSSGPLSGATLSGATTSSLTINDVPATATGAVFYVLVTSTRSLSGIAFCQDRFSGLQGWCSNWGARVVIPLVAYSELSVSIWVKRPLPRRFMPFPEPSRSGTASAGC
jgi:hypothetical protein